MPWLVCDDRVLASLEIADTMRARFRGLLGRDAIDGALLIDPARSVHTIGMRMPIDVAFCDRDDTVVRVVTLRPNRVTRLHLRARRVVEAEAGAFARWGVAPGTQLDLRR